MEEKKPKLSKRTIYTIFLAKFLFSLALIFWTIKMTLGAGVGLDDDNTFLSTYKNVDDNYNNIILNNRSFSNQYDLQIIINGNIIDGLSYGDIYLSQRVIKERKIRKNMINIGDNTISLKIIDKITKKSIDNINAKIVLTMPSTHKYDTTVNITDQNQNQFEINKKSYWNIMGSIKIKENEGHFYIKTNAK